MNGLDNTTYWLGTFLVEMIKMMAMVIPIVLLWNFSSESEKAIFHTTHLNVQLALICLYVASSLGICLVIATLSTRREFFFPPFFVPISSKISQQKVPGSS